MTSSTTIVPYVNENGQTTTLHMSPHLKNPEWFVCVQRINGNAIGRAWVERDFNKAAELMMQPQVH